jgi:hypothetical protein
MLAFRPKALDVAVVQGEVHNQPPTVEGGVHNQPPTVEGGVHNQPPTVEGGAQPTLKRTITGATQQPTAIAPPIVTAERNLVLTLV